MSTLALRGKLVTGTEVWEEGTVLLEDAKIRAVGREEIPADRTVDLPDSYLVPGFVDLQVNGAFGVDVVSHPERLGELSAALPGTGVTSYLPTVITLPLERYPELLSGIPLDKDVGAEPLGLHLEGPFISPKKSGAHSDGEVALPEPGSFSRMLEASRVRLVTLAPELPGAHGLIRIASERGVVVSLGHSDASFDQALAALEAGAESVTHLFNAMSPLHHRDPGLPGAALAHPVARCGIIADGKHLHPEMVRLAFERLGPDRMYLVTDAMSAAGMGAGKYTLAGRRVSVEGGVPRLEDGTLAGGALTMDEALRNVVEFSGCSLPEAVRMTSTTPARLIGERKGSLVSGFDADVVALSKELEVEAVWAGGREVEIGASKNLSNYPDSV